MSSRTQLLIPTKGPKRADYLYIGHQQGILLHLRKEKETLKNMVMYVSMLIGFFVFITVVVWLSTLRKEAFMLYFDCKLFSDQFFSRKTKWFYYKIYNSWAKLPK